MDLAIMHPSAPDMYSSVQATLGAIGLRCRDMLGDLSRILSGMIMISPGAAAIVPHIQGTSATKYALVA